jgi:hypothetical protein
MEATSRPPLESLPDLPVEEPADAPAPDTASTQTLLQPEALLALDDEPTIPGLTEAPMPELPQLLEVDPDAPLTLESSLEVDRMLSSSPPSAPVAQPPTVRAAPVEPELTLFPDTTARVKSAAPDRAPTPPGARPAPAAKSGDAPPPAAPALVPLARRASISAAAEKLAAAAAAAAGASAPQGVAKPSPPVAAAPTVVPVRPRMAPTEAAASVTPIARKAAAPVSTSQATAEVPPAPAPPSAAADAPSLASWASARAAAASSARTAAGTAPRPAAPAAKPAPPAPAATERPRAAAPAAVPRPAPAAAAPAPAATPLPTATPARGMDRDFIARNQVVDRYFSGKLPIKAATEFERYCNEHPELLDELGVPERVHAGLRLLEASGKPEPWQEAPKPIWQKPASILAIAGLAFVLMLALAIVVAGSSAKSRKILELQRQVADRTLDAATSTRIIRLLPSRAGATNTPAIVIGDGAAKLVDFRIDESRSPYKDFRITIDRLDQGRVMIIDNLTKDSNGHLRVAVNSSAFGPGNYLLTIEGLTMRLEPQPDSWVTIGIAQR